MQESFLTPADEAAVRGLYHAMLEEWNRRDARAMADLFAADGSMVGFDGSPIDGRAEIYSHIAQVFADHQTAAYIGKVREVRGLAPSVALLRAVCGMIPPGKQDINPAVNAVQCLVAVKQADGRWRAALYQNTPAQFHGRPDAVEQLTNELRALLPK